MNELFAIDAGPAAAGAHNPMGGFVLQAGPNYPATFEAQHGIVYKLLDENFGLIRVSNCLALFDTCDLFTRPGVTAAQEGRRLSDILEVRERGRDCYRR